MVAFRYEAELQPSGKTVQGLIEALDEAEALDLLAQQNLIRIRLITSPVGQADVSSLALPGAGPVQTTPPRPSCQLRLEEKINFFRNASKMMTAGIPMADVLERLASRTRQPRFRKVLLEIRTDILAGSDLETALDQFPESFDGFAVKLIGIGEKTGNLDQVTDRIGHLYHRQLTLRKKLLSAAIMPLVTLASFALLALVIFGLVVPILLGSAESMGLQNPVLDALRLLLQFWYIPVGALALTAVGAWTFFFKTEFGQAVIAEMLVIIPVFKDAVIQSQIVQFLTTLHLTYSAGIPLGDGVGLAIDSLTNHAVQETFQPLRDNMAEGMSLASALLRNGGPFPETVFDALVTGEETGTLDSALKTATAETDAEVQLLLDRLPDQLKPIAILALFLLLAGLLSIFYGTLLGFLSAVFQKATFRS